MPPIFPNREFDITRYGAVGDGRSDCTQAIRARDRRVQRAPAADASSCRPGVSRPAPMHLREQRQPARRARRDARVQHGTRALSARGAHALRGHGADELLAVHLCVRSARTSRSRGEGTLDGQADRDALVAVEGQRGLRMDDGHAELQRVAPASARRWPNRACRSRDAVSARATTSARTSSSRTAAERADRGRDDHRTRRCGRSIPVLCQNVTVRGVTINSAWTEQRRLRSGVLPRRAHRALRVQHRRRLHRDQVGPQRRRPPRQRAEREHHRPQLRHARRTRRRDDRQRDLRRLLERVRARLPHGQPAARSRAATQEQRDARRRARATSTCATSPSARWPTRCCRSTSSTRKATRDRSRRSRATSRCGTSRAARARTACIFAASPNAPIENVRVIDCHFDERREGQRHRARARSDVRAARRSTGRRRNEASRAGARDRPACAGPSQAPRRTRRHGERPWSVRVAESVMKRNPVGLRQVGLHRRPHARSRCDRVGATTDDPRYAAYVKKSIDSLVRADGTHRDLRGDRVQPRSDQRGSRALRARRPHARPALHARRRRAPRAAAHASAHGRRRVLAQEDLSRSRCGSTVCTWPSRSTREYALRHGDTTAMNDVARQFLLVARHLRDPKTGLYYHAWDSVRQQPWADPATGLSKNFWGRAVGWYLMAAVDVLDYLPKTHRDRAELDSRRAAARRAPSRKCRIR